MSKKQVESILGPPTNIDNKDFLIMKKTTYVYRQGNDTVTIVFKDDKVTEKQSTLDQLIFFLVDSTSTHVPAELEAENG